MERRLGLIFPHGGGGPHANEELFFISFFILLDLYPKN